MNLIQIAIVIAVVVIIAVVILLVLYKGNDDKIIDNFERQLNKDDTFIDVSDLQDVPITNKIPDLKTLVDIKKKDLSKIIIKADMPSKADDKTIIDTANQILKDHPFIQHLEDRTFIKPGDYISMDFEKIVGGDIVVSNGHESFTVGDNEFDVLLEEKLLGMSIGKEYSVDYYDVSGIPISYKLIINALFKKYIFDLESADDNIIKNTFGIPTKDEFLKRVEEDLNNKIIATIEESDFSTEIIDFTLGDTTVPDEYINARAAQEYEIIIRRDYKGNEEKLLNDLKRNDSSKDILILNLKENVLNSAKYEALGQLLIKDTNNSMLSDYAAEMAYKLNFENAENMYKCFSTSYESGKDYIKRNMDSEVVINQLMQNLVVLFSDGIEYKPTAI